MFNKLMPEAGAKSEVKVEADSESGRDKAASHSDAALSPPDLLIELQVRKTCKIALSNPLQSIDLT